MEIIIQSHTSSRCSNVTELMVQLSCVVTGFWNWREYYVTENNSLKIVTHFTFHFLQVNVISIIWYDMNFKNHCSFNEIDPQHSLDPVPRIHCHEPNTEIEPLWVRRACLDSSSLIEFFAINEIKTNPRPQSVRNLIKVKQYRLKPIVLLTDKQIDL